MLKFSVIIPLYNKSYSIEKCINSVLFQTHTDYQIIIVNDGSKDNSLSIVKELFWKEIEDGTILLVNQHNQGVSIARNNGVALSSTEYICFLDADDEWKSQFLSNMKLLINDYPLASLYCLQHETKLTNHQPIINSCYYKNGFRGYVSNFYLASIFGSIANSSKVCIKKSELIYLGGFPTNYRSGEDLYVWMELARKGKIAFYNKVSVTVNTVTDESRMGRSQSIPYPLIHYSKPENIDKLSATAKLYLRKVYLAHLNEPLKQKDYNALLARARAGKKLFPIINLSCLLLISIKSKF